MRRLHLVLLTAASLAVSTTVVAQSGGARTSTTAARERLRVFEGSYRVSTGSPGDTTTTIWRWRSVLGGKYLELEEVFRVAFRVTVGFDSTMQHYRLSLLDAGSGAVDIYDGDFDAGGSLVLQNPQFWRITLTRTTNGMIWLFSRSTDGGATWRDNPTSEMIRIVEPAPRDESPDRGDRAERRVETPPTQES